MFEPCPICTDEAKKGYIWSGFQVDLSIRRAGRLSSEVWLGVPSISERADILSFLLRRDASMDLVRQLAAATPGYVGADLLRLCDAVREKMQERKKVHLFDSMA